MSCTFMAPLMKNSRTTRVVFPNGEIRQFSEPTKAAELMLECPNYFLANSQSLHIGRRFSALSADEELEFGNIYIMFPMKRVTSIVTAADVAILFMAANTASKRISIGKIVNVSPGRSNMNNGEGIPEMRARSTADKNAEEKKNGVEEESENKVEGIEFDGLDQFKYRLSVCRSRKPMLETISEDLVYSK